MEYYDTIVIGAGTAGLSAARELKDGEKSYLVIDGKKEIGKPIRSTGGVALFFANKLGMPQDKDIISAYIQSIRLEGDDGRNFSMHFDHPVGIVYDFTKYEQRMAHGLNIRLNERVLKINGRFVITDKDTYSANNIIIATGPNSALRPPWYTVPRSDTIVGYEETRVIPQRREYDLTLWFSKFADGGYIWDFPDAGSFRRVGLGFPVTNNMDPRKQLADFTMLHPGLMGDVDHTIAHQIPVGRPAKRVVDGNRAWIGDVVGTCQADTGGGLQTAFWSGQVAARAILAGNIHNYQETWNRELYPHLMRHYRIKRIMYNIGTANLTELFDVMRGFAPKSENATREIPRLLGRVILRKPSLLPSIFGAML